MKYCCRICKNKNLSNILELGKHPISHRLLLEKEQKEYTHPVNLVYCDKCGLIQLVDPIPPNELYSEYNWLSSWKPNPQIPELLSLIKGMHELTKTSKIIEIGSNDGSFLNELKKLGYENLLGIEPSMDGYQSATKNGIKTIHDYFSENIARTIFKHQGKCDLIICRHVLEHIQDIDMFSAGLSKLLRPSGHILIEVPDADFILNEMDYSQIWEEHTNYFTLKTLSYFFSQIEIQQTYSGSAQFSGQSLIFTGKKGKSSRVAKPELTGQYKEILAFKTFWPHFKIAIHKYLQGFKKKEKKIALYGAGCRACSLLNFTDISKYLDFVVDDQLEKLNLFLPGSKLPVFSSKKLLSDSIDICFLAVNSENNDKVIKNHQDYLDNGGIFIPILPKSKHLPSFWQNQSKD